MITINNQPFTTSLFPNKETLAKDIISHIAGKTDVTVDYTFTGDASLIELMFAKRRLDELNVTAHLFIQYMPYSRMDRKIEGDLFTLDYIVKYISWLNFSSITIVEPHSDVTVELFEKYNQHVTAVYPTKEWLVDIANTSLTDNDHVVFPDKGAKARYADLDPSITPNLLTYEKRRDPHTGQILSIELDEGSVNPDSTCIIVDDLCSKGGTFMGVASDLKARGAKRIVLVVAHTEDTVFDGPLLLGSPVDEIITSRSILTKTHPNISLQSVEGDKYVKY